MSDDREIIIRPAAVSDAETLHALVQALSATTDSALQVTSVPDNFREHGFGESRSFEALLAEKNGEPVGLCLFFHTFSSWRGEPGVYIQDLYVSDDVRGTGLGRKLLAETVRLTAKNGATHMTLCVDSDNTSAAAFYAAVGIKYRDDEHVYEAEGDAFFAIGGRQ